MSRGKAEFLIEENREISFAIVYSTNPANFVFVGNHRSHLHFSFTSRFYSLAGFSAEKDFTTRERKNDVA